MIFDNDGVLVDSEGLANQVLADLLAGYGWQLTQQQCIDRFLGTSMAFVREAAHEQLGRPLPTDFEARYHAELFAAFPSRLHAVPGAREAASRLAQQGWQLCVASSGSPQRIRLALALTGLAPLFGERLFSADDVAAGKPAPDLFLYAAGHLGVAPERCLVVEDSAAGVTAARAAGMTVYGYAGLTPASRLAGADAVFDDMSALPGLAAERDRRSGQQPVHHPGEVVGEQVGLGVDGKVAPRRRP